MGGPVSGEESPKVGENIFSDAEFYLEQSRLQSQSVRLVTIMSQLFRFNWSTTHKTHSVGQWTENKNYFLLTFQRINLHRFNVKKSQKSFSWFCKLHNKYSTIHTKPVSLIKVSAFRLGRFDVGMWKIIYFIGTVWGNLQCSRIDTTPPAPGLNRSESSRCEDICSTHTWERSSGSWEGLRAWRGSLNLGQIDELD